MLSDLLFDLFNEFLGSNYELIIAVVLVSFLIIFIIKGVK